MLVEFSVANFRSIKEIQTLNMTAANISSKNKELDKYNILPVSDKLTLLKSKVIYGANASGKSNIIKALVTFLSIVDSSVKDDNILDRIIPFRLSTVTEDKPTFFQIIFIANKVTYRYGFEATSEKIISEWLFGSPNKKEVPFFTRQDGIINVNEAQFKEGTKLINLYKKDKNEVARENSLFLTTAKTLNGKVSRQILDNISAIGVITGLSDRFLYSFSSGFIKEEQKRNKLTELLRNMGTGIESIDRIEIKKDNFQSDLSNDFEKEKLHTYIFTEHNKFNKSNKKALPVFFELEDESEGSQKMFEIAPFILTALENGFTLFIDEFDARFHPILTKKLIELFNSNINKGAQFIIMTHDTNLLSSRLLRRDQISFTEKDKYGATHLYDLVSFKGIRNDASLEKDYIAGKYGAIPFIGDFSSIIEE